MSVKNPFSLKKIYQIFFSATLISFRVHVTSCFLDVCNFYLITKKIASELRRKFIKSALLVGHTVLT